MINKNDVLANFILKGLKEVNMLCEKIDFTKTTLNYIKNQLPKNINNNFLNLNSSNIDESFFNFLKKNEKFFKNLQIHTIDNEEKSFQQLISNHFKNIHQQYNSNKLFYFYFELILIEELMGMFGGRLSRSDLKERLFGVLRGSCQLEKVRFTRCLGQNLGEIDVIAMSDFGGKLGEKCKLEKEKIERCIFRKLQH